MGQWKGWGPEPEDSGRCAIEGCDLNSLSFKPDPALKVTHRPHSWHCPSVVSSMCSIINYTMTTQSGYCALNIQFCKEKAVDLRSFPLTFILITLWDVITPLSVVHHLMGSRQGNKGPLPPPHLLTGCLCWLRHTGLAGPVVAGQELDQWRFLKSCRSAAATRSPFPPWAAPPL